MVAAFLLYLCHSEWLKTCLGILFISRLVLQKSAEVESLGKEDEI
jgi:hypothetical protein